MYVLRIFLFFCVVSSFPLLGNEEPVEEKKKILILSSFGGYAHTAAEKTLQAILKEEYNLKIIHPINEIIKSYGFSSGENIYNAMLSNGWIKSMNFIAHYIIPPLFKLQNNKIAALIQKEIEKEKPDLVVSLIPFINLQASKAAEKHKIPYLIISVDYDLKNYVLGLDKLTHPNFQFVIGANLNASRGRLLSKGISEDSIKQLGLPLRLDFTQEKNKEEIKKEYNIPEDKQVILLMMGGAGSKNALKYTKRILKMKKTPVHLIVCAGKDTKLKEKLKKIPIEKTNSITIMGFTDKVSDLMAVADLLITKPGPGTLNEAMASKLPVLVDVSRTPLYWERRNIEYLCQAKIGNKIKRFKDTERLVKRYLTNKAIKTQVEESYAKLPQNEFHTKIKELICEMSHAEK